MRIVCKECNKISTKMGPSIINPFAQTTNPIKWEPWYIEGYCNDCAQEFIVECRSCGEEYFEINKTAFLAYDCDFLCYRCKEQLRG